MFFEKYYLKKRLWLTIGLLEWEFSSWHNFFKIFFKKSPFRGILYLFTFYLKTFLGQFRLLI